MGDSSNYGRRLTPMNADSERLRVSIRAIFFFLLLVWLVFNWFEAVRQILDYYNPLPTWDYWRVPEFLNAYKAFDVRILWKQHNEHRIVFPEIVFALDMLLLHGREILPLAVSFLCYFGVWVVLAWTLFSERALAPAVRNTAILLAGIIMGWKGSAFVLASPFLLQWTLMQLAVVLSFAFLSRFKSTSKGAYFAAAILSGIVATYSSGNALLLWPLLLVAGALLSFTRRQMAVLAVAAVVSVGVYFIGYSFTGKLNLSNFILHPFYSAKFLAAYLSMPFGGMKAPEFGVRVGLTSLLVTVVLLVIAARTRLLRSQMGIVLFGSYSFTVLTALVTAAGRMEPTDPHFNGAESARYVTVPLANWAVFICLCLWIASRRHWKFASARAIALVVIVLLLVSVPKLRWWLEDKDRGIAGEQLAALSVEDGLRDGSLILKIFPHPAFVELFLPELRSERLSIFYKGRDKWLGQPVAKFSKVLSIRGSGAITYTYPVESGVEVWGWADESRERSRSEWIVLSNELGEIVGFGRRLPAGFPRYLRAPETPPSLAWVGFVNLNVKTASFTAYIVDARRRGLIPIGNPADVPGIRSIKANEAGPEIAGLTWQIDPSWRTSALPPGRYWDPPAGPIYASWGGHDENTGRIASSIFPVPANSCIVLPVLHGPSVDGLFVDIVDADTGKGIASTPMQDGECQWQFWRVPITTTVKHARVIAQDQGRGWGQWLAMGGPRQCQ